MYYDAHTHNHVQPASVVQVVNRMNDFEALTDGMIYSAGLHPWHLDNWQAEWPLFLQAAAKNNVVAIGECGLDKTTTTPWVLQTEVFTQQVLLAQLLQKPLIIHCVRAYSEVMSVLQKAGVQIPVVFHGFNRGINIATPLLQRGYTLSFGAHLLRPDSPAGSVLQQIRHEQFLLETDDADIPIQMIYKRAAEIRKTTEDAIILQAGNNFKKLFGIS
jgi:TatD DNase family protein